MVLDHIILTLLASVVAHVYRSEPARTIPSYQA